MTVTAKPLIDTAYASNAQTTVYTAPAGTRTIIDKFYAFNNTGGAVTLAVNIVTSGGAAGAGNLMEFKSIPTVEGYGFPAVVGQVLDPGDFISVIAGAATSVVLRASGREVS